MKSKLGLILPVFGLIAALLTATVIPSRASQSVGSKALEGFWGVRVTSDYNQAARIDNISPSAARPGDQVTIRGNGFGGRNVAISVGGVAAHVLEAKGNTATFFVPAAASPGPTLVTATNPGGHSGSIAFTVQPLFAGSVIVSVDETRQVSALIGPDGGQLSTTTADGAVLTLTIPADALIGQEQIFISPVAAIAGLPLSGGLLAAAQFAPQGLLLFKPATLTIQLPPGKSTQGAIGFAYESNGANFHLSHLTQSDGTLTLLVSHFSGAGAGTGTAGNVNAIASAPQTELEAHYLNLMVQAEVNLIAQICGPSGLCSEDAQLQALAHAVEQSWTNLLGEWFVTGLRPLLAQATASTEALENAKREFVIWQTEVNERLCFASDCPPPIPSYVQEGREALGAGYLAEIQRVGAVCDDTKLAKVVAEVGLLGLEGYGGLPDDASDLINTYSCALVIEVVGGFPSLINIGQAVPFNVKLSRHHEGQLIPVADTEVKLEASGCGFLSGGTNTLTGLTGGSGVFATQVTGSALCDGQEQVVITTEVETTTESDSANVLFFGQTRQFSATVRAGVSISPQSVTLSQGQTQQFTAAATGVVNTGITWSVTGGGSINQTGLYTAGSTGGTVKATSVADPSKSATASVSLGVQVTVTPASVTVPVGGTAQFTVMVTGTANQSVTWAVAGGTITQGGLFTAGATTGEYFVTATSVADPNAIGVAQVRVAAVAATGFVRLGRREAWANSSLKVSAGDDFRDDSDQQTDYTNAPAIDLRASVAESVASECCTVGAEGNSRLAFQFGLNASGNLTSINGSGSSFGSIDLTGDGYAIAEASSYTSIEFTVMGGEPVRYQLIGQLNTAGGGVIGDYTLGEALSWFDLSRQFFPPLPNPPPPLVTKTLYTRGGSDQFILSQSGELAPGTYKLQISTISNALRWQPTTETRNRSERASVSFTLTFLPASGQP